MKSQSIEKILMQVRENTPKTIVETIALQLDRQQDAKKRIDKEGIVVRDMKGSVIQHPAIKIEIEAGKIVAEMLMRHKK